MPFSADITASVPELIEGDVILTGHSDSASKYSSQLYFVLEGKFVVKPLLTQQVL